MTLVIKNILKFGKGILLHALYDHYADHVDNGGDYDGDDDNNGGDDEDLPLRTSDLPQS